MAIVCLFHKRDLDGWCCAAIAHHRFPGAYLRGIDYGEEFPWEIIGSGNDVYLFDYHPEKSEDLDRLIDSCGMLKIADHHVSFRREMNTRGEKLIKLGFTYWYSSTDAACEIAWSRLMRTTVPDAVRLIGDYDTWRWKQMQADDGMRALHFQYGLRAKDTTELLIWRSLLFDAGAKQVVSELIENGRVIYEYVSRSTHVLAKRVCYRKSLRFVATGPDYNALLASVLEPGSLFFEAVRRPYDELLIAYVWDGSIEQWKVSLYSDKVDCSEIARKFGGGGHESAAGFTCKVLPFVPGSCP